MGLIINPYRFPVVWATATGGNTVTTVGDYKVHKFTSSGSFVVTKSGAVEYLVVAGGGSGGRDGSDPEYGQKHPGGNGGGGGFRTNVAGSISGGNSSPEASLSLTTGTYSVTVGAGGTGGTCPAYSGNNSVFHTITSIGGGGGGSQCGQTGSSGGSGGGASAFWSNGTYIVFGTPGSGTTGQGFQGAYVSNPNNSAIGGGAGGTGGAGGAGLSSSIDGVSRLYAGGGGGGGVNTGNGGAGSDSNGNSGYAGGSGIVIIRYKFQ